MTPGEVAAILDDLAYRDWSFRLHQEEWALQVIFSDPGSGRQHGRKWRLSQNMTRSEVVQTAFKAVLTAEEHEARERFRYRGAAIFGPHFDVEDLVDLHRRGSCDARK